MGVFDFLKKKKIEEEFDRDDHLEEEEKKKTSKLRPIQYSSECEKIEDQLRDCVSKNNGLYGCANIMEKYKICRTKDLDFHRKEEDRRDNN